MPWTLVGPAGVVAVAGDGERQIGGFRHRVRLAVVQRFELRQLVGMLFNEIGQPVEQPAAFGGRHAAPWRFRVESGARRFHGLIDVGGIRFGDVADRLAGRRVDGLEAFAGNAFNPLAVDQ